MPINMKMLLADMFSMVREDLPHDPSACKECAYHPNNLDFAFNDDVPYCYMFADEPTSLCMSFEKVK